MFVFFERDILGILDQNRRHNDLYRLYTALGSKAHGETGCVRANQLSLALGTSGDLKAKRVAPDVGSQVQACRIILTIQCQYRVPVR